MELRLAHGGIVDRNAALMEGDIVYVQFKTDENDGELTHLIGRGRKGRGKNQKRKEVIAVDTTKIGAFDSCQVAKDEDTSTSRYFLKQMDFKHLECMIMTLQIKDQQELVKAVNNEWA